MSCHENTLHDGSLAGDGSDKDRHGCGAGMDPELGVYPPCVGVHRVGRYAKFCCRGIARHAGRKASHDLSLFLRKPLEKSVSTFKTGQSSFCCLSFLSHSLDPFRRSRSNTNRRHQKTSRSCFLGGPEIALREYEERKRITRFSAKYRSRKFLRFPKTTALQHCKLISADFSPP